VEIIPFPLTCDECGGPLGGEGWGRCLLCGRFFCGPHVIVRKGVATCEVCQDERRTRESSGGVADSDEQRVVALITQDISSTIGAGYEEVVVESAARVRLFVDARNDYEKRVVDDVQQRLHDEFVSTVWPRCPTHPNHPLWCSGGWWRCEHDGHAIAPLGGLADLQR
jgi:hypothetical protein